MKGEEKGWAYLLCACHRRAPGVNGAGRGGGGEGVEPAWCLVVAAET